MGFKTSAWFTEAELQDEELPEELRPEWSKSDAVARGELERGLVMERLYSEGEMDLGNALADCGQPFPLVCVCCGEEREGHTACRKRWCPACSWQIQRRRIDRFKGAVELMEWPAFLTLTQANSPDPETIRELRKAWGKMRRRKMFEGQIKGGVAAIEVTNEGEGWHPHLHAIIDCEWLAVHTPAPSRRDSHDVFVQKCEHAQAELSSVWASVVKQDTAICWIERMRNLDKLRYSLKYAVKGSNLISSPDPIGPLLRCLEKTRCISAFGNLHGRTSEMDADERPVTVCGQCGTEKSYLPVSVIEAITRRDPAEIVASVPVTIGANYKPFARWNK